AARRALSRDQARVGRAHVGAPRSCPRRRAARAIHGRRAGLRGQIPASARSARGADQARYGLDRENGRASPRAIPGAIADSAAAPAVVIVPRTRCAPLPLVGRGGGGGPPVDHRTTPTRLASLATLPTRGRARTEFAARTDSTSL